MTKEQFHDLQELGRKIGEYCKAMENLRALRESRGMLAKGLRSKYPNMKIEAIRDTLWRQEMEIAKTAQLAFDEMRMNAYSLGWEIDYKDVESELGGIIRRNYPNLNDIAV